MIEKKFIIVVCAAAKHLFTDTPAKPYDEEMVSKSMCVKSVQKIPGIRHEGEIRGKAKFKQGDIGGDCVKRCGRWQGSNTLLLATPQGKVSRFFFSDKCS